LVLPLSSWAFWAGLLSNATEIHVNSPGLHPLMDNRPQYIYHSDRGGAFFGIYNKTINDIEYAITKEGIRPHIYPLKSLRNYPLVNNNNHNNNNNSTNSPTTGVADGILPPKYNIRYDIIIGNNSDHHNSPSHNNNNNNHNKHPQ
jgi:hypothetical protein